MTSLQAGIFSGMYCICIYTASVKIKSVSAETQRLTSFQFKKQNKTNKTNLIGGAEREGQTHT